MKLGAQLWVVWALTAEIKFKEFATKLETILIFRIASQV